MKVDKVVDIKVDKVADMKVDMVANMEVDNDMDAMNHQAFLAKVFSRQSLPQLAHLLSFAPNQEVEHQGRFGKRQTFQGIFQPFPRKKETKKILYLEKMACASPVPATPWELPLCPL